MSDWIPFGGRWSRIPLPSSMDTRLSDDAATLRQWDEHAAREKAETFCGQGLNKPGTQVDVDGKHYLIGHVNRLGGNCDDCVAFDPDRYVRKYRVLIPEEELRQR